VEPGITMFVVMLGSDIKVLNPYTIWDRPLEPHEAKAARISRQSAHEGGKVVNLSTLGNLCCLHPTGDTPVTHLC
jgi:hypothetical protein